MVGAGLGTARIVDSIKPFVKLHRKVKMALGAGVSVGVVIALLFTGEREDWQTVVGSSLGAWGLSQITHAVTSYLTSAKDETRTMVWEHSPH
jgi:hypothetical protein